MLNNLVAILFAIVVLLYAQLLRAILARPFLKIRASAQPRDTQAPTALADLYARAAQELSALGFEQPLWVLHEYEAPGTRGKMFQVYQHRAEGSLVWLGPPADLRYPNRLATRFSTRLADGRTLCSQMLDPYFGATATPEAPVQTLKGASLEQQWAHHLRWRRGFSEATDARLLEESAIVEEAGPRYNLQIDRLVQYGRLWRDDAGVARARLGFALRILGRLLRRPAPYVPSEPVPAPRLALLSEIVDQARSNAVPLGVQWGLFATSVMLFLLLGGFLLDTQLMLILLGVVAFHEAGHYLAMRGFGYHNVQMLMLPLVGGVTLGVEKTASAAQRAWMSLMGPLPGILLGWALYGWILLRPGEPWPWIRSLATTLLVVNYLNVLPIPPLDGSRVVQSLLPARWTGLQAVLMGAACVIGGMGAVVGGYPRLGIIALATLATLPFLWQRRTVVRSLLGEGIPARELPPVVRLTRVLETFERLSLPMKGAQARILQAEAVLQVLDTESMQRRQRLTLTGVYGLLAAVPVAAFASYLTLPGRNLGSDPVFVNRPVFIKSSTNLYVQALGIATTMEVGQLAADLRKHNPDSVPPPGLSEEQISAIEAKLGARLPEDIRAVYRVSDGLPVIELAPLEQATRPDTDLLAQLTDGAKELEVLTDGTRHTYFAKPSLLANTIRLGPDADADSTMSVLIDLNRPPMAPGRLLLNAYTGSLIAFGVRQRLEACWASQHMDEVIQHRRDQAAALHVNALRGDDVAHLLGRLPEPGFLVRTFFHVHAPRLPAPVSDAELSAAERRLGRPLPPDLHTLLLLHDGLPQFNLLHLARYSPVEDGTPLAERVQQSRDEFKRVNLAGSRVPMQFKLDDLHGCVVIGGYEMSKTYVLARVLWCQQRTTGAVQILDLQDGKTYPDITALLRQYMAYYLVNIDTDG